MSARAPSIEPCSPVPSRRDMRAPRRRNSDRRRLSECRPNLRLSRRAASNSPDAHQPVDEALVDIVRAHETRCRACAQPVRRSGRTSAALASTHSKNISRHSLAWSKVRASGDRQPRIGRSLGQHREEDRLSNGRGPQERCRNCEALLPHCRDRRHPGSATGGSEDFAAKPVGQRNSCARLPFFPEMARSSARSSIAGTCVRSRRALLRPASRTSGSAGSGGEAAAIRRSRSIPRCDPQWRSGDDRHRPMWPATRAGQSPRPELRRR